MKHSMEDRIKSRNSWFKIILISLFTMVLMFKVATAKFTFHFSDLLSFILAIFAVAISVLFYSKVNEIVHLLGGAPGLWKKGKKNEAGQLPKEPVKNAAELRSALIEHKEQLKRVKKVQNEIIDRLMANQDLLEEDRRDYIDYMLQKEKEAALIQLEMDKVHAELEGDEQEPINDRVIEDPAAVNSISDIVAVLGKDVILSATFDELNQKVKSVQPTLNKGVAESLMDSGLVDQNFNITRKGLKELRSTAKKMKKRS